MEIILFQSEILQWHGLTREEQAKYYEKVKILHNEENCWLTIDHRQTLLFITSKNITMSNTLLLFKARQERQRHMQMYPHWNAR